VLIINHIPIIYKPIPLPRCQQKGLNSGQKWDKMWHCLHRGICLFWKCLIKLLAETAATFCHFTGYTHSLLIPPLCDPSCHVFPILICWPPHCFCYFLIFYSRFTFFFLPPQINKIPERIASIPELKGENNWMKIEGY
jgi:hypothetical protein